MGNSGLIVWAGYRSRVRATDLDRRAVGAIAKPLVHASAESHTIAEALNAGLGVALPGEAWRNQLPKGHQKRSQAFQRLPFAQADVIDPLQRWPQRFIDRYAVSHLDAQMSRGATIVTTAAHHFPADAGAGRANDVALAKAAVREFRARRGHHPARDGWPPRVVFASIIVESRVLPDAAKWLVDTYRAVESDGYWIVLANTRRNAAEVRAMAELAFGLEAATGNPVVVSCVGRPHATFLAHGLAAVSAGHNRGSFAFPPYEWPEPDSDADEDGAGIGVFVYHEQVRGAVELGHDGERLLKRLFERWPCTCGHHPPAVPPATRGERLAHNQWVLEREVAELCDLPLAERPELLDRWLADAADARAEMKMGRLNPSWRAVGRWRDQLSSDERRAAGG